MAVTGHQVYEMALALIDEVTDTGQIVADNPEYYKARTLPIITNLQAELLPQSITPTILSDLNEDLLVSDRVAISILPYGVAAHLLLMDDIGSASYYNNRYDELKGRMPSSIQAIEDVYDITREM